MTQAAVIAEKIPPRERILAAATELFYRHGIRAVGVDAIAEAAETNKMTLYRHFTSKDELVAEYLRKLFCEKELLSDQLFMLLEGAFVSRQSVGDHGPACQFVRAGQALINANSTPSK